MTEEQWLQRAVDIMAQAPIFRAPALPNMQKISSCIAEYSIDAKNETQANEALCKKAVHRGLDQRGPWLKVCIDRALPSLKRDYYFLTFNTEASKDAYIQLLGFAII